MRRVWIDTDPAISSGNGEVDDGYALLQALGSPELNIIGVSAVFGNTDISNTYPMAQDILARAGADHIQVFKGHACAEARGPNAAADAIVAALNEGPLTLAALGPLTNIAAALLDPRAALNNVEEIVFVGGRRIGLEFRATPDQLTPFADLNFELDVKAAQDLLALSVPITLAGWEVSSQMWLRQADLDWLRANTNSAAAWLSLASQEWHDNWSRDFKAPGFTPFDTLAIGWLLRPELFESYTAPARVRIMPERALFEVDAEIDGPRVTYLRAVNNEAFREDLMSRLLP